jgi:predicted nucleic acid-binding protein
MEVSGLTAKMFDLPYTFAIPDILYYEELEEEHSNLLEYGIQVLALSSDTVKDMEEMVPKYPKASRNDLFALALAKQESCPLVTGDNALRKACEKEEIDLLGTLWIIDQLIYYKVIDTDMAHIAYMKMKENKRRLPWDIIGI